MRRESIDEILSSIWMQSPGRRLYRIRAVIAIALITGLGNIIPTQATAQKFDDVPANYWAFSFIEIFAESGISAGCGGNSYCPENAVTRSQMAVFLERAMHGSSFIPPVATGNVFLDVGAGDFAAAFIEQLFLDNITAGCGGSKYCPSENVTRAQMAVFLLRAKYGAGFAPPPATGVFTDVPAGSFAADWIEKLASEGISSGCGGGNYCPGNPVNRAQMAIFMVRAFGLKPTYSFATALEGIGFLGRGIDGRAFRPNQLGLADLNGDNLDDIILHLVPDDVDALKTSRPASPIIILLNNGAGGFVLGNGQAATGSNIPGTSPLLTQTVETFWSRFFIIQDFNGDGQLDVFIDNTGLEVGDFTTWPGEQNQLLLSAADGELHDVSATHLPQHADFSHGSSASDIDGDGDIDIWVNNLGAHDVMSYLMVNDGAGHFSAVADLGLADFGLPDNGPRIGLNGRLPDAARLGTAPFWSVFIDVDSDTDPDLFLGVIQNVNGTGENQNLLLINDGTGSFLPADQQAVPPAPYGGAGLVQEIELIDINLDGRKDLVLGVFDGDRNSPTFLDGRITQILINNGDGTLSDETAARFPPQPVGKIGATRYFFRDFDGDGDVDLLTGTFDQREFFENNTQGVFSATDENIPAIEWFFIPVDVDGDGNGMDFIYATRSSVEGNDETVFFLTKRQ